MSREYRVMVREGEHAIYEVYYDDVGRIKGYSVDPVLPAGESLQELRANCVLYLAALEKPVLKYEE